MRNKKYLYLLLLLILPIIFFSISKISLNNNSKAESQKGVQNNDTLAAKSCKEGDEFNYTVKVGESVEIRSDIAKKCGYGTGTGGTSGSNNILQGNDFISLTNNASTSGVVTTIKGTSVGNAKVELYYVLDRKSVV